MRKVVTYFAGGFLVILAIIISFQIDKDKSELSLEAVLGNSIFNAWDSLNEIVEDSTEEISIESIKVMNENLISIEAYANVIDRIVAEDLLLPIVSKLLNIGKEIEENHDKNGEFTEVDIEKYKVIVNEAKNVIEQIYIVYYVPDSEGKVKLEIENFRELANINERLNVYDFE
ncbi:hypothetical protein ACFFHH_24225 [Cytobacillus solani]|uniref:Uncharacterized protein n=1 Tax=Cytobacillus solani TaxID=1637975 RepID=A0A0Q3QNK1_9BACI|nr:hypothetical protein [Cytobacillus solani]KOP82713.1 hypothetical protein AMS60_09615 [Bacillus sp. FJAT-21945]KQL19729.1 hypothetical protein AN957_14895 [Cytobacillus solani]USK52959.1 hypothetical protein LIS82_15135 [Cytobacillus solani]